MVTLLLKMADFLLVQLPLFFLLITVFPMISEAAVDEHCPISKCKHDGPLVKFPFRLKHHPLNCGHPDFEVFCLGNMTMIKLSPSSGLFSLESIDFANQRFEVYDQDGCLPRKLLNFTIPTTSPIKVAASLDNSCDRVYGLYSNNLTILNCSTAQNFSTSTSGTSTSTSYYGMKNYFPINCLSVPGHHQVLAAPNYTSMADLPVPTCATSLRQVDLPLRSVDGSHYNCELDSRLFLQWAFSGESCRNCNGSCDFDYNCNEVLKGHPHHGTRPIFRNPLIIPFHKAKGHGSATRSIIIPVSIACFVLILATVAAIAILYCVKQSNWIKEKEHQIKIEKFLNDHKSHVPTRYSYADIKKMTNGFKRKLGEGGFGSVFRGKLPTNGALVAVKVLKDSKGNGQDFVNEVGTIGRIHHVNVVRLLGFSSEGGKRALIYELMPNRSLEKFIKSRGSNNNSSSFDWEKLHHIIIGIAKGIEYLHQGCDQRILHFDIKPHNILLDHNLNPKISDFGLAKLCSKEQSAVSMTTARGTAGYIAPEVYGNFGTVSYKSDVYSFGMLVLETIGATKSDGMSSNSDVYFPKVIYNSLVQGDKLDLELHTNKDARIAKRLVIVAIWCIQWYPFTRPSMKEVVRMLEGASESLVMPPNPFASTSTQTPLSS